MCQQGNRVWSREREGAGEMSQVPLHIPSGAAEAACPPSLASSLLMPPCLWTVMLGLEHLRTVLLWPGNAMQEDDNLARLNKTR